MKKLKVGVVGVGRIGRVHLHNLVRGIPEADVVAVTDPRQEQARELARQYDISAVSPDYDAMVGDSRIDAVVLCSPTSQHASQIRQAARAGKHIFCEKPIDLSLPVIQDALDEVDRYEVQFMVGFNRRFDPGFSKAKERIEAGEIGDPHLLRITSRDPGPPPPEYIAESGGLFLDMTIHDFDIARYVVSSEVVEVYANAAVLVDPRIGELGDVDTAVVTLSFENGALGLIDNSRKACYGYDQRLEVFGSRGMVQVDNHRRDSTLFSDKAGAHLAPPLNFFMDRYAEAYAIEMAAFVKALTTGSSLPVTGEDGLRAVKIALAAKKSAAERRPVSLSEIA
jgi:myo-inositol 2-dehydrogenase / D-chiro-inositol 1-dehydrogenase